VKVSAATLRAMPPAAVRRGEAAEGAAERTLHTRAPACCQTAHATSAVYGTARGRMPHRGRSVMFRRHMLPPKGIPARRKPLPARPRASLDCPVEAVAFGVRLPCLARRR